MDVSAWPNVTITLYSAHRFFNATKENICRQTPLSSQCSKSRKIMLNGAHYEEVLQRDEELRLEQCSMNVVLTLFLGYIQILYLNNKVDPRKYITKYI